MVLGAVFILHIDLLSLNTGPVCYCMIFYEQVGSNPNVEMIISLLELF